MSNSSIWLSDEEYKCCDRNANGKKFNQTIMKTIYVLSRNKKKNVYPCIAQFYYIKVEFKGVKII